MGLPRAAVDLLLAAGFTNRALVSPAECLLAAFQVYSRVRSYSDVGHGGGLKVGRNEEGSEPLGPPPKRRLVGIEGQRQPFKGLLPHLGREQIMVRDDSMSRALSFEEREKKATKADSAPVPISLWTQHYVETGSGWKTEDESRIEAAMNTMRGWFLLHWRRRTTRSFFAWLHTQIPVGGPTEIHWHPP